jgi:hypothetical protein
LVRKLGLKKILSGLLCFGTIKIKKKKLNFLKISLGITKKWNSGPEFWNIPPEFFDFLAKKFRRNLLKDGMFRKRAKKRNFFLFSMH